MGDGSTIQGRQAEALVKRGLLLRDESLEGLAGQMDVDATTFTETVADFNRAAREGGDIFGRVVIGGELDSPPYYACRVFPTLSGTGGGVRVNGRAQALDAQGQAIPGLWAAGEVTGGLAGVQGPSAVVFGRVAGRNAATN